MACDAAFDAHARDRFAIQRLGPMQRGMIERGYFRMQSPTMPVAVPHLAPAAAP